MNFRWGRRTAVLLLAVGTLSICGYGQVPTGTILGTVTDAQGLAVPSATVTLVDQETSRTEIGRTSSRGGYEFSHLNAGLYKVEVSKAGFKTAVATRIKLDASTEYSVPPIILEVGPVSETVTVEAGADLVRTAGAEITNTVEKQQIEELPLRDRNPLFLLSTQAGVTQNHRNRSFGLDTTVINGQRQSFSSLTLDGINIQDNFVRSESLDYTPNLLFMSQVGEFTATTQNGGPQAGMGSSQVSMITPSGTNDWHGEGFWYYRTNAWKANDWFNDANGIAKPNLLLNQGGADIGGPLLKDRLFVYGAYELYRSRSQQPTSTTVLTGAARSGIFQWRATCTTNCPGGVTPGSIQSLNVLSTKSVTPDPFMVGPTGLMAQVPTTINNTSIGDGLNTGGYLFNQRDNESRDNVSLRVDWDPAPKHSFSGTYAWNRYFVDRPGSTLGLPDIFSAVPVVYNREADNFVSLAWRWTPASSFTNEVRFGFNLSPVNFFTNQKFGAFTISNTLFNNPDQNEFPSSRDAHTWSWQDNASWSRGNHVLNFGIQVQRVTVLNQRDDNTIANLDLDYTLSGRTALSSGDFPGGISTFDLETANKLLATLGGLVGSETQTFNVTSTTSGYVPGAPLRQSFRYNTWSLYGGDSWRFRRNLALTYGLRWEYLSPFDERDGLLQFPTVPAGQTIQEALLSDATLAYFGGNTGRSVYRKDLNNFGPNLGIAWDPFGDSKTSVRAGYCINFVNDELIGAPYNANLSNPGVSTQTGPVLLTKATTSSPVSISPPTMSNTFSGNWIKLYGFETALSFGYAVDPKLQAPYVQQWNLSIQREIGWNSSVTVAYVGNKGTKLYRAIDLNQVQIKANGFLQAFNSIRQNGFNSLVATGIFNVCYVPGSNPDCTASNPNAGIQYLANNFFGGLLNFPSFLPIINQYAQEGQVGELANLYHSSALDAAYFGAPIPLAPNQFVLAADLLGNYSHSDYHAGVVEFRRRFRKGFNFQASYTFSRVFTDFSADTPTGVDRFLPYLDNANPGLEKERANFDVTHAFKANFIYQLPLGKGQAWSPSNAFLGELVSGWTASSIFTWQSGAPFSIFSGQGTLNRKFRSLLTNTAFADSSPQQIAAQLGVYQSNGEVLLINPKYIGRDGRGAPSDALTCAPLVAGGFCNPQPGMVGNLPRNAFNGPVFFNWDLSILKSVAIAESKSLKLRLDMFNAPNHPVFAVGDPNYSVANPGISPSDMYINDPKFGVATSTASTPRVLQVGLVFAF